MPADRDETLKKAEKLLKQGKVAAAIEEYVRLVEDKPSDWNSANTLGDLYLKAGQPERAADQFTRAADHLYGEGFFPRASAVYKKVLKVRSADDHSLWQLADIAGRNRLSLDARSYYARLIQDRRAAGNEQGAVDCLVRLGLLEDATVDAKRVAAKALVDRGEIKQAARLILGVAVALTKEERLPDALEALKEAAELDPQDQEIRDRLADATPVEAAALTVEETTPNVEETMPAIEETTPVVEDTTPAVEDTTLTIEEQAPSVELAEFREELVLPSPSADDAPDEHQEVAAPATVSEPADMVVANDEGAIVLEPSVDPTALLAEMGAEPEPAPVETLALESFFEELRGRVARDQEVRAREQFEHGVRHLEENRPAEAMASLEEASRTPALRFEAASSLARICLGRGDLQASVDWMERALEAPAPAAEDRIALMYDLADTLARQGETARAMALFMEVESDVSGYRDVRERITRLSQTEIGNP